MDRVGPTPVGTRRACGGGKDGDDDGGGGVKDLFKVKGMYVWMEMPVEEGTRFTGNMFNRIHSHH